MRGRVLALVDRRSQGLLLAATATGIFTGLLVAGYEVLTNDVLLDGVRRRPVWVQAAGPALGLLLAALALRYLGKDAGPATADEYVASFHEPRRTMSLRAVPARLLAGIATIGFGGAMGLEGPSIYIGASVGTILTRRLHRLLRREDAKVLLVAGAAAGVAAVFKAPATGVVFALEVPYIDDVAPRALIPALLASAAGYLTFVGLVSSEPLFDLHGSTRFSTGDLVGALVLGVLCGVLARAFAWFVHVAKTMAGRYPWPLRVGVAGVVLAGLAVLSNAVFDHPFTLGPGYQVLAWAADPKRTLPLIALLFALRLLATTTVVGGGGAGGLFIPLAVLGVLVGRFVGGLTNQSDSTLFPVIGLAAFLGAGYRTPIASVMFVAETTGKALYVVPALVAAAVSQLFMGRHSVSSTQQSTRLGHLERRFRLPVTAALTTDVLTVPSDATVAEFVWVHVVGRRAREVPVVGEDRRYLGMCRLADVSEVAREEWETTLVCDVVRTDLPTAKPTSTLRDAIVAMEEADVDVLAVVDGGGMLSGLVLLDEILKLDEVLEETGG